MTSTEDTDIALSNLGSAIAFERSVSADAVADFRAQINDLTVKNTELNAENQSLLSTNRDLKRQIAELTHTTAIGASLPLDNLYGNTVEFVRIFLQGDAAIPLGAVPQGASVMVSRKTRGGWFGTRLADARRTRPDITLYGVEAIHEPEDNVKRGEMTVEIYKAQCREDVPIIRAAGAIPVQVLMGGSVNDGTASQYWVEESEQIWYDVYHGGAGKVPDRYKAPEVWLKPYFDAAAAAGKPMGFAEFGSRTTAADNENYAAPAYIYWLRENSAYCRSHPDLVAASWFNFGAARIRFQNQAMADAWLSAPTGP